MCPAGRLAVVVTVIAVAGLRPGDAVADSLPYLVADLNTVAAGSTPEGFLEIDGTVYFAATDPAVGRELWKSDGTVAGTVLVKDIYPGPG